MKIKNTSQLKKLYQLPSERAEKKEQKSLDKHSINFIDKSPFLILSTSSKQGKMDASPRGGNPGFVKVLNSQEIVFPDSKGNNRLDSLTNIVETGAVGMLFLIPGVDETLRLNGPAYISTEPKHLRLFNTEKIPPKTCVVIRVEEVFLHCAKALMRSKLWDQSSKIERTQLPTMGEMLRDQLKSNDPIETQENMIKRYQKDL